MEAVDYELSEAIRAQEDDYDREFEKQMLEKFPQLNQLGNSTHPVQPKLTNKDIIKAIINVIGSDFVHQDPREDGIGNNYLSFTDIEKLDLLYFKQSNKNVGLSESKYQEYVDKIKSLDLPLDSVQITKFAYLGKFIEVKLMDINLRFISKYKAFEEFKSQDQVSTRVDKICNYLKDSGNLIPREFIEWVEFSGGIERG